MIKLNLLNCFVLLNKWYCNKKDRISGYNVIDTFIITCSKDAPFYTLDKS